VLGHEVEVTENGEKAVELYQAAKKLGRPFDGVILDLTVRGGMGGVQTIKALQEIDPLVKAVVSSGYADDPVMVDYERYGFRGALAKPMRSQTCVKPSPVLLEADKAYVERVRKTTLLKKKRVSLGVSKELRMQCECAIK